LSVSTFHFQDPNDHDLPRDAAGYNAD